MKLLFIDHVYHQKTHSSAFFIDILRKSFTVTEHWYSRFYHTGAELLASNNDMAVIWEFPISRNCFYFYGMRNVFVPMYDNEWASYWQWKRIAWSGMGVISFCDKITKHAIRCGVKNILDIKYFPDPANLPFKRGNAKRVFLWERGAIIRPMVEKVFCQYDGYEYDIKGANEFLTKEQYLRRLSDCDIVIAPRRKEGIGMSFLEAMAMGKCVVAHNDATMNEYIEDGITGLLIDFSKPRRIKTEEVMSVLDNIERKRADLFLRWTLDKEKINKFIEGQKICRPSIVNRMLIILTYPLYLIEGTIFRVKEHLLCHN